MSAPPLQHKHVWGINSDCLNSIHYLSDTQILYVAGHNVILYNLSTKQQQFIHGTDTNGEYGRCEISCLTISPNSHYLCIGEKSVQRALLTVADLTTRKKKKLLINEHIRSREYLSINFSTDNKHLVVVSGSPDYTISLWNWTKNECITSLTVKLEGSGSSHEKLAAASAANNDSNNFLTTTTAANGLSGISLHGCTYNIHTRTLCMTGKHCMMMYQIAEDFSKITPLDIQYQHFNTHNSLLIDEYHTHLTIGDGSSSVWVLASISGVVLVFDGQKLMNVIYTQLQKSIEVMRYCKNGDDEYLLCGCDHGLVVALKRTAPYEFTIQHTYHVDEHQLPKVVGLTISPNMQSLLVLTDSQQLLQMKDWLNGNSVSDSSKAHGSRRSSTSSKLQTTAAAPANTTAATLHSLNAELHQFQPLLTPFHTGPITGLDVCIRKPIILTCGVDRSVRIWNYETFVCELCIFYHEQPYSVALHPTGLHCIIGFHDKIKICNILMDDIRVYKELPIKQCLEVRFSHGGQYFACTNGALIQIYNTYTGEQLYVFRGHTAPVKSLWWSADDTHLVSAGTDGAIYERKLGSTTRVHEHLSKNCKYLGCTVTPDDSAVYVCGDDRMLKEVVDKNITKSLDAGVILTQLVLNYNTPTTKLFASTINGVIRSFCFPLTGVVKDYQTHTKSITRLRITSKNEYLISVGDDGCLYLMDIDDKHLLTGDNTDSNNPATITPPTVHHPSSSNDEILITKTDLEEKYNLMLELRHKIEELHASHTYQLRLAELNHQEQLNSKKAQNEQDLLLEEQRLKELTEQKDATDGEHVQALKDLRLYHASELHHSDVQAQKQMIRLVQQYQALEELVLKEEQSFEQRLVQQQHDEQQQYQQVEQSLQSELQRVQQMVQTATSQKDHYSTIVDETKQQLQLEMDMELQMLRTKYETELNIERDSTLRLKGENSILQKKFLTFQKEIDEQLETLHTLRQKKNVTSHTINSLDEQVQQLKGIIRQHDNRIGGYESQIYRLKNENLMLEKWKYVYDHTITQLKSQIEPREQEINKCKVEIHTLDDQLTTQHSKHSTLQHTLTTLHTELKLKHTECTTQRNYLRQIEGVYSEMMKDLCNAVEHIQDGVRLKSEILVIYNKYVAAHTESLQSGVIADEILDEYKQHHMYLTNAVNELTQKLHQESLDRKDKRTTLITENTTLIEQIQFLRQQIAECKQTISKKDFNQLNKQQFAMQQQYKATIQDEQETHKLIQMQRQQIETLKLQIENARHVQQVMTSVRPGSRDRQLTPLVSAG